MQIRTNISKILVFLILLVISIFAAWSANLLLQVADSENLGDAYVYEGASSTNYGNSSSLYFKNASGVNDWVLIEFNISSLNSTRYIENAELKLYSAFFFQISSVNISVYEVYDNFTLDENVTTWDSKPNTTTQFNPTALDNINHSNATGQNSWATWTVTSAIQNAANRNNASVTLMLRAVQKTAGDMAFYSKDYGTASYRPILNITYSNKPTVSTPTFTQSIAYVNTNLIANTTYSDLDGDKGNVTFTWYVNGVHVYNKTYVDVTANTVRTDTISSANYTHFQVVNVSVVTYDNSSVSTSALFSSDMNISNTIPVISSVVITPDPAVDSNNLTCTNSTITDTDGDAITLSYTWYNNSVITPLTTKVIGAGNISTGQQWYCNVNASDSYNWSGAATSQTVIIGSSYTAPTINYTNATTAATVLASTSANPTNNDSWVNLSVTFNDPNTENWTAYFCKTNAFDGSACTGGQYCRTVINSSQYPTVTCNYTVNQETATTITYYAYVLDNESLHQGSGSGKSGTFIINYPPPRPAISNPQNQSWIKNNYSNIQFLSTDPDSDNITYYVYASQVAVPTTLINSTTQLNYNWTELNESNYYVRVLANDTHGYESTYSLVTKFSVDMTIPIMSNFSVTSTLYTDQAATVRMDCYDYNSTVDSADYNISTATNTTSIEVLGYVSNNRYSDSYSPLGTPGTYNVSLFRCLDVAGNIATNTTGFTFVTSTRPSDSGSGSSSGPTTITIQSIAPPANVTKITVCGNNICEEGESPSSCPFDCKISFDRFITCIWDPNISCVYGEGWFVSIMLFIIVGGLLVFSYQVQTKKKMR